MATILRPYLFSWTDVERSSDLDRFAMLLAAIPDEALVCALEARRGHGRDRYPVRAMWNAVLAGIVMQHPSVASLRRELGRNAELRQICGCDPGQGSAAVPSLWAMSRFVASVVAQRRRIEAMFAELVGRLTTLLPDLGEAAWGTKTSRGTDTGGKAWEKVTRWFGYQLHLVVDARHEVPVAYEVRPASVSEVTRIVPMVEALARAHPEITRRCRTLAADRGLDAGEVNRALWQEYGITPVIDTRRLWKDEQREPGYDPSREITRALDRRSTDTDLRHHDFASCSGSATYGAGVELWHYSVSRRQVA